MFKNQAPLTLEKLDTAISDEIRQRNYIKSELTPILLATIRDAYAEACCASAPGANHESDVLTSRARSSQ